MSNIDPAAHRAWLEDHDRHVEEMVRILSDQGRDPEDGCAPVVVPTPPKPDPRASAIAVPLPAPDDRE